MMNPDVSRKSPEKAASLHESGRSARRLKAMGFDWGRRLGIVHRPLIVSALKPEYHGGFIGRLCTSRPRPGPIQPTEVGNPKEIDVGEASPTQIPLLYCIALSFMKDAVDYLF